MVQWCFAGWLSLGIHIDPRWRRIDAGKYEGLMSGPYVDLHLGPLILSFGRLPEYTPPDQYKSWCSRGGRKL
jgi:hypothetical protein